ncbi:hypothetical protein CA85_09540 [Allorhodopirellula solitaria]|uniref:Uncharacterized protein n=2 Tax=Allorhodopirellula solitaria TaxID=2527987 RepID=A0A5C5YG38_9BACT|nr:hypothetical protein CA85_09540 [Allorhodopirellula solitaria]
MHLAAVFTPPMAFQSRGPRGLSPSVSKLLAPLAAYGQFLYLDRGYAFFAPDPGPSHLMRAVVGGDDDGDGDGDSNQTSRSDLGAGEGGADDVDVHWYPDLNEQWPRLLYHRHFMLAEFLNDSYHPKLPANAAQWVGPDLPLEELKAWRLGRERYDSILGSMTDHLRAQFGERSVRIDRVEHGLPDFVVYASDPTPLDDPSTYIVIEDISIPLESLLDVRPESLPPGPPPGLGSDLSVPAVQPLDAPGVQGGPVR